jgi:translation initiation factor 2B subunit (eIF-2B alpha/beta/delta family)
MADPALKLPPDPNIEALDILRRLEPVLSRMASDVAKLDDRTQRIETEQKEQRKDISKIQQDIARIDGRLIEMSARVPTIWTIATLIFAIFGASFVLIRFAGGH